MKIGIFAPSSACAPERFKKACGVAQGLGFQLDQAQDPSANYGVNTYLFSSASPATRIAAFEELIFKNRPELILAARGGYGAVEILPQIFDLRDKIDKSKGSRNVTLCGLSDVTALLLALDAGSGITILHGPCFVDAFFDYHESPDRKRSCDELISFSQGKWSGYQNLNLTLVTSRAGHEMKGKMLGGNLSVLVSLIGTSYLPSFHKRILFLEETGEKPYRIHRALSQLKLSGLLDDLAGVLLGDFSGCFHDKGLGPTIADVFNDIFSNSPYPVFAGFPGGHSELNLPLPMGTELKVDKTSLRPV